MLERRIASGCLAWQAIVLLTLWGVLVPTGGARAFEAFDGRLQVHGFFETQLRGLSTDFAEQFDIAQWYNILNVEIELSIAPDGFLFFDLVEGFVRVEGRFDCVYYRGCGMFKTVDVYGDRARRAPERLNGSRDLTYAGSVPVPFTQGLENRELVVQEVNGELRAGPGYLDPVPFARVAGINILANLTDGADGYKFGQHPGLCGPQLDPCEPGETPNIPGDEFRNDDPFPNVFGFLDDYRFVQIDTRGGFDEGLPTRRMGPWLPKNTIETNGLLADEVNPFDNATASDLLRNAVFNVTLQDPINGGDVERAERRAERARGLGARPFRPIPVLAVDDPNAQPSDPRGFFLPSNALVSELRSGRLDSFDFNFSEVERSFNRGASQEDQKELKEAYLDLEFFESRLWLRVGLQSIVWGKTELFRTTDQFNPQDLALASLPSLEESRISLWALRGVWSFYQVGPLEDVRAELAFNYDDFEPADLGACGEPYTVNAVCELTFGGLSHGFSNIGIVGVDRPKHPWQSLKGWEVGGRLEFRWDRFSFALTDFWGYEDFPFVDVIYTYERNVDPAVGLPRVAGARAPCTTGDEPACLKPGPTDRRVVDDGMGGVVPTARNDAFLADTPNNALDYHHANQSLFTMVCSTTIGFNDLDPTACAQTAFGSTEGLGGTPVSQIVSAIFAGSEIAANSLIGTQTFSQLPLVKLSRDPGDLRNTPSPTNPCFDDTFWRTLTPNEKKGYPIPECGSGGAGRSFPSLVPSQDPNVPSQPGLGDALGEYLTPEQEALLGCGPFWGTSCDDSGIDLLNAEASVILQSFVGFEGTTSGHRTNLGPQPGTVGFEGGPVCTVGLLGEAAGLSGDLRLPGCRGPGDPGYDIYVDGNPGGPNPIDPATGLVVPSTGLMTTLDLTGIPELPEGAAPGLPRHPLVDQVFQNELAAASWNFMQLVVTTSAEWKQQIDEVLDRRPDLAAMPSPDAEIAAAESFKWLAGTDEDPLCSFVTPQYCNQVQLIHNIGGVQRNVVRAGGNGRFGRRTFQWHSGGEAVLRYDRRNVLGLAVDFAEDRTKSSWSFEFTWIGGVPSRDFSQLSGITDTDDFNLTVSIDRPTFVNFLNSNRTFFVNSQWFIQYRRGWNRSFAGNGPWNMLGTLTVNSGYFQDRFLPQVTFVYDVQSVSGAAIPQVTYRFNESFSASIGAALFMGRTQLRDMPINPLATAGNRQGAHPYEDPVENGLAAIRDRDEIFLRIRYTF